MDLNKLPVWQMMTEEQKNRYNKLVRSTRINGIIIALKLMVYGLIGTALGVFLQVKYIHSLIFCFFCGVVNGFMAVSLVKGDFEKERLRIEKEVEELFK